jgi:hypothetical protein
VGVKLFADTYLEEGRVLKELLNFATSDEQLIHFDCRGFTIILIILVIIILLPVLCDVKYGI